MTDCELASHCMTTLIDSVGPVETERFLAYMNRNNFDYTEWQRNLFAHTTLQELCQAVRDFEKKA